LNELTTQDADPLLVDRRKRALDLLEKCAQLLKTQGDMWLAASLARDAADECDRLALSPVEPFLQRVIELRAEGRDRQSIMRELDVPGADRSRLWRIAGKLTERRQIDEREPVTLESSVARLEVPARARFAFERYGIETVGHLVQLTDRHFAQMKNLGRLTVRAIKRELLRHGLELAPNEQFPPLRDRRLEDPGARREWDGRRWIDLPRLEPWQLETGPIHRGSDIRRLRLAPKIMSALPYNVRVAGDLVRLECGQKYRIERALGAEAVKELEQRMRIHRIGNHLKERPLRR
jgi:hypothetical protein